VMYWTKPHQPHHFSSLTYATTFLLVTVCSTEAKRTAAAVTRKQVLLEVVRKTLLVIKPKAEDNSKLTTLNNCHHTNVHF